MADDATLIEARPIQAKSIELAPETYKLRKFNNLMAERTGHVTLGQVTEKENSVGYRRKIL